MAKARPWPVFGPRAQSPNHRIAVHVAKLLDPLPLAVNIEVIVSSLPERPLAPAHRDGKLDRLHGPSEHAFSRLADKKMHMLGHDYIAGNNEVIASPHSLERGLEKLARVIGSKVGQPVITTEGEEMKAACLLITDQSPGSFGVRIHRTVPD